MRARATVPVNLLVAVLVCLSAPTVALNWGVEVAYDGGMAGADASLAVTGSIPRIAYTASGWVALATRSVEGWASEWVAPCGFGGGWCSTAPNPLGLPGIAYIDCSGATSDLWFARKVGLNWVTEYVDEVGWLPDYVSLVYDSAGVPMIAYCRDIGQGATIKMARRVGENTWSAEDVASVGEVTGPIIALDSSQCAYISFVDVSAGTAKLACRSSPGSWTVETVDGSLDSPAQWYTSLRFDQQNQPTIAYFADSNESQLYLKFAKKSGAVWTKEQVAALPLAGAQYCSLALDANGVPSIAYLDSANQHAAFARKTTGGWFSETVDEGPLCGYRPSLALNGFGNPLVAYVDFFNGFVKYAITLAGDVQSGKLFPDGRLLSIENVVTSTSGSDLPDMLYVQERSRAAGIQVYFGGPPPAISRGTPVHVSGVAGTRSGERCVLYPTVTPAKGSDDPVPLFMPNRSLGGGNYQYDPGPPAHGQQGVYGGTGVNNIGLLVRAWGRVHSASGQRFGLDDGSGVPLTVRLPPEASLPEDDTYVVVTGASSCEFDAQQRLQRLLRARSATDVVTVTP